MKKQTIFYLLTLVVLMTVKELQAEPKEIRIEASEYKFTISPGSFKVGEPAVLVLVNKGKVTHEFESDLFQDLEAQVTSDGVTTIGEEIDEIVLAPKKTATIKFVPQDAGKFEFACRQTEPKDHFKEGMHGSITVQE